MSHHSRAPNERDFPPVRRPFMEPKSIPTAQHDARAQYARVLHLSPEKASVGACALGSHATAGLALETAVGMSHHGRASEEKAFRRCGILRWSLTQSKLRGTPRALSMLDCKGAHGHFARCSQFPSPSSALTIFVT